MKAVIMYCAAVFAAGTIVPSFAQVDGDANSVPIRSFSRDVRYHVTLIPDDLQDFYRASVRDLNDAAQVVGSVADATGGFAFLWSPDDGTVPLAMMPDAINSLGHIAGTWESPNQAVFWSAETGYLELGDLLGGGVYSWGEAVNDFDQVVGRSANALGIEAYYWDTEHGMIGLGDLPGGQFLSRAVDINNSGVVLGTGFTDRSYDEVFIWDMENGMRTLPELPGGGFASVARGINNLGQITGMARDLGGFFWDPVEGYTMIRGVPTLYSTTLPAGLNDRGEVVGMLRDGMMYPPGAPFRPFIWDRVRGFRLLDELLDPCTSLDGVWRPVAINNHGQIVANPDGNSPAILLTPYLVGDFDGDGAVDLQDLTHFLSNFGRSSGAEYADGDLDCDADVDLQDLATLLASFGQTYP